MANNVQTPDIKTVYHFDIEKALAAVDKLESAMVKAEDTTDKLVQSTKKATKEWSQTDKPLNNTTKSTNKLGMAFSSLAKKARAGLSSTIRGVKKLASNLKGMAVTGVAAVLGLATGLGVTLGKSIEIASDRQEQVNQNMLVFGNRLTYVKQQLQDFAGQTNSSGAELVGFATKFASLLSGLGFSGDAIEGTSVLLSKLSVDFASFFNLQGGASEAAERLNSGLKGNHENLELFNIFITEASLKSKLAQMGLDGLTGAALENAKTQARLAIIMEKSTIAQGDAARTADGFANSTRGLSAMITDLASEIGLKLLPYAESTVAALKGIIPEIGPGITQLAASFAKLIGVVFGVSGGVDGLSAAINKLTGFLSKSLDSWSTIITVGTILKDVFGKVLSDSIDSIRVSFVSFADGTAKSMVGVGAAIQTFVIYYLDGLIQKINMVIQVGKQMGVLPSEFKAIEISGSDMLDSFSSGIEAVTKTVNEFDISTAIGNGVVSLLDLTGGAKDAKDALQDLNRQAVDVEATFDTRYGDVDLPPLTGAVDQAVPVQPELKPLSKSSVDKFEQSLTSTISSVLGNAFSDLSDLGIDDMLPRKDAIAEDARRLADVMVNGWDTEAGKLLAERRPDLKAMILGSADPKAVMGDILSEFQEFKIDRYGLIDKEAAKERIKKIIFGQTALNTMMEEIKNELIAEGLSEQSVQMAVNAEFSQANTDLKQALVTTEDTLQVDTLTASIVSMGEASSTAINSIIEGIEGTDNPNKEWIAQLEEIDRFWQSIFYNASGAIGVMSGAGLGLGVGGTSNGSPTADTGNTAGIINSGAMVSPTPQTPQISNTPIVSTGRQAAVGSDGGGGQPNINISIGNNAIKDYVVSVTNQQIIKSTGVR